MCFHIIHACLSGIIFFIYSSIRTKCVQINLLNLGGGGKYSNMLVLPDYFLMKTISSFFTSCDYEYLPANYRPSGVPDNTFVCTRLSPERRHRLIYYGSKFCVFLLYAHWKQSWKKRSSCCISRYI